MGLEEAIERHRKYFTEKIEQFGPVPEGVDYNGAAAQLLRFEQLVKVIDPSRPFTILDYGCGYGALLSYLQSRDWAFTYLGYDMLETMVQAARLAHPESPSPVFTSDETGLRPCEYVLAGSIFNNKFEASNSEWRDHTLRVLARMNSLSSRGFAFNVLTSYSDPDRMALRPDLYFADPLFYFDHCKRTFSRDVALLHDYTLYDFTILVRKQV